jgi:hypothetical protein
LRTRRGLVWLAGMSVGVSALFSASGGIAQAQSRHSPSPAPKAQPGTGSGGSNRSAKQLGKNWYRGTDIAVSSYGDSAGMHYFVGRESEGFAWRPLATILPAGTDASSWTGYQCLSGDDRYLLATIEPTAAANRPEMLDRGALSYSIDVKTGKVTPVVAGVAMYYHSPGCGTGHTGVLARYLGSDQERTELLTVDMATGKVVKRQVLPGQFTSVIPLSSGKIAAYHSGAVVTLDSGSTVSQLEKVGGAAFDLAPSWDGGLDYLSTDFKGSSQAWHLAGTTATKVGSGPLASVELFAGAGGHNLLSGVTSSLPTTGAVPLVIHASKIPALMSRQGHVMGFADSSKPTSRKAVARPRPLPGLVSNVTGKAVDAPVPSGTAAPVSRSVPAALDAPVGRRRALAATASSPLCAVPRNDVHRQVLQPTAAQVEWAADQAVRGSLPSRPANFANMNLGAYNPGSDLPLPGLSGGAGGIPVQVLLGVFAQESNFYQASWHALPGVGGNPLIADYYGGGANNVSTINYPAADCGYGLGQITSGMHAGDTVYPSDVQAKIAVDYTENAAAAAKMLEDKWNQTYGMNIRANNADPKWIENWYLALWAYNSGINPGPKTGNTTGCTPGPSCTDGSGNWGLGWTNNPENTSYPPNRDGFLRASYADAAKPANWPYQEKILGWAETPILNYKGNSSYAGIGAAKLDVPLPKIAHTFCVAGQAGNNCDLANANHCTLTGSIAYHCWWHIPATWADCTTQCYTGAFTYNSGAPEPATDSPHPPDCNSSLPSSAYITDDEPTSYNVVGCSGLNWSSQGSFALTQGADASGVPISVIDTHQLGAGFGGHLFFTHNRAATDTSHLVTGTWKMSLPTQVYHVLAHVPSTGGTTRSAHYVVTANDGKIYDRVVDQYQQQDQWAGVGFFALGSNAQVTLNNVTDDAGLGAHDVAFDAIAFVPVPGTLVTHMIDAVSLFDPNQDLNTNMNYLIDTPARTMTTLHDWAVQYGRGGSKWDDPSTGYSGVALQTLCPSGTVNSSCVPLDVFNVGNKWATDALDAGTSTTGHAANGMTEPTWLGFGNLSNFPPATTLDATKLADDTNYKVKSHLDVSFVVANGQIVPGSQDLHFRERTASTHIPDFVANFMNAVQADYGITRPNLAYSEVDANLFSGDPTPVDPLNQNNITPGRDYVWHADSPTVTDSGTCVATHTIMGGSIGWRPLAAQTPVANSVLAWVKTLKNDSRVNSAVANMAAEIDNFFFAHPGDDYLPTSLAPFGSLFLNAGPIWQQIHAKICVNGSISSAATVDNIDETPKRTIADQSYMPNLYLYYDNKMIDNAGASTSSQVHIGNFANFSNMPALNSSTTGGNAFGVCSTSSRGAGGNPWNISPPGPGGGGGSAPDIHPKTGTWCDTGYAYGNPYSH